MDEGLKKGDRRWPAAVRLSPDSGEIYANYGQVFLLKSRLLEWLCEGVADFGVFEVKPSRQLGPAGFFWGSAVERLPSAEGGWTGSRKSPRLRVGYVA